MKVLFLGRGEPGVRCLKVLTRDTRIHVVGVVASDTVLDMMTRLACIPLGDAGGFSGYDLGISVGHDTLLPKHIIERAPKGFINIHYGPLPGFRGNNSAFHAIRLARRENSWHFGITLHYMDEGLDTGPIIDQVTVPIYEDDTAYSLYTRATDQAPALLAKHIPNLLEKDRMASRPQDEIGAHTYGRPINHEIEQGYWIPDDADDLYDQVRARLFKGKPRPYFMAGRRRIYMTLEETE